MYEELAKLSMPNMALVKGYRDITIVDFILKWFNFRNI